LDNINHVKCRQQHLFTHEGHPRIRVNLKQMLKTVVGGAFRGCFVGNITV